MLTSITMTRLPRIHRLWQPFSGSVYFGNLETVKMLLAHGATSKRPNHYKNLFKQMLEKWMNI
jgi:hypothetical protein